MKFHLHHSPVTGKILGYTHDFCNTMLPERETPEIPFITHNLFCFDFFYFLKGYVASTWCSKLLNTGGNNLTHVNYGNIHGEIRFIYMLKYYQRSLAELTSMLTEKEKAGVKK